MSKELVPGDSSDPGKGQFLVYEHERADSGKTNMGLTSLKKRSSS
jgi:hypothetical protein